MKLTSDGRSVVTSSPERDVVVRDTSTWRTLRHWPVRAAAAALSPDDRTLLVGDAGGAVRFLDLAAASSGPAPEATTGRWSGRNSARMARRRSRPARTGMIVWDVARASAGETLGGHAGQVTGLVFSDDGETLYSSSLDGKVMVSDLEGSRRLGRPFAVPANATARASRSATTGASWRSGMTTAPSR